MRVPRGKSQNPRYRGLRQLAQCAMRGTPRYLFFRNKALHLVPAHLIRPVLVSLIKPVEFHGRIYRGQSVPLENHSHNRCRLYTLRKHPEHCRHRPWQRPVLHRAGNWLDRRGRRQQAAPPSMAPKGAAEPSLDELRQLIQLRLELSALYQQASAPPATNQTPQ